jgi:hypothetical protein
MRGTDRRHIGSRHVIAGALATVGLVASGTVFAQQPGPTFTKDIAPILQDKCQVCHRIGEMAPMPLVTYQDARPWARAMKAKVVAREMPPWYLDRTVGIQKYKNDMSLSDEQVATIAKWVDAGAPQGNVKDMPPAKVWPDSTVWQFAAQYGPPDVIVKATPWTMPAHGQDQWWKPTIDVGLTEDRWVRAVELRPTKAGRRIVHHAVVNVADHQRASDLGEFAFVETSIGSYGEAYREDSGKLLKAGTKFQFDIHYHAVGEELTDQLELGLYFYPKGTVPTHEVLHVPIGLTGTAGRVGSSGIDIAPNSIARHDAYMVLQKAARIENFKPHMHMRGKAMALEAIYPDGRYELLSYADRFNFNWGVSYVYADDSAPVLPKGTTIHVISWHDNTSANKSNPDPSQWVGQGSRSIDEMTHAHTNMTYLSEEEYQQIVTARKRAKTTSNDQQ